MAKVVINLYNPSAPAQRVRETLPQIGYGQGDVVATPMRMARVAAAIASDGVLREAQWEQTAARSGEPDQFLNRNASRVLAHAHNVWKAGSPWRSGTPNASRIVAATSAI